jgi:hypothetical protein
MQEYSGKGKTNFFWIHNLKDKFVMYFVCFAISAHFGTREEFVVPSFFMP